MQPLFRTPAGAPRIDASQGRDNGLELAPPPVMDPTPDKEQPDQKPPSRGTSGESAEERKFWAAEEEDDRDAPTDAGPPADDAMADEQAAPKQDDPFEDDLDEPAEAPAPSGASEPGRPDAAADAKKSRLSRKDTIWIGLLALVLLGAVIWAVTEFLSNVQTVGRPDEVDFPVKGSQVVIDRITTYWRKPDPETDRVQLDTHLVPSATIVLNPDSGDARLRCFFENEVGDYIGDPVTLAVAGGTFAPSGQAKIDIHATGGLKDEGEYNAYAATDVEFWHLRVFEGPSSADESEEFQEIVSVPISPKRR